MHFFVRKRRQTPAVIIVALIDVLIVLVIFLLVTTTFKQRQYMVQLAESSQAQKVGASESAPLIVSVDAQGNLRFGADAKPMTLEQLRTELVSESAKKADVKIAISADKAAPFGQIVKVMDVAKESKIKMVNAFTKEAGKP
jgi:biopolymer transport protein ExbD